MKHIDDIKDYLEKTYLPLKDYKIGDYVELYSNDIGKIVDIKVDRLEINDETETKSYIIEILVQNKIIAMPFLYENIKRILTPEEVEQYKIALTANKYNL